MGAGGSSEVEMSRVFGALCFSESGLFVLSGKSLKRKLEGSCWVHVRGMGCLDLECFEWGGALQCLVNMKFLMTLPFSEPSNRTSTMRNASYTTLNPEPKR